MLVRRHRARCANQYVFLARSHPEAPAFISQAIGRDSEQALGYWTKKTFGAEQEFQLRITPFKL